MCASPLAAAMVVAIVAMAAKVHAAALEHLNGRTPWWSA